jgi:alpha-methylacyl-CoA racemase
MEREVTAMNSAWTDSPLAGVRVLDLTRLLPGPVASLILADLGATVDKVEDPQAGDYARISGPQVDGHSGLFHTLGRGKRSLILDLKHTDGPDVLKKLAARYDVVFEQFRPGVLDRLGVGHDVLMAANPKLVVCALTGYGQTGPLRDRAGHDVNYMARAGLLGLQGPTAGPPQLPAFQIADVSGGLWCAIAILAALQKRDRTGKGSVLDIAMSDCVAMFALPTLASLLVGAQPPKRGEEMLSGGIAVYDTYETKDHEAVALGALEPKFFRIFCEKNQLEADFMLLVPGPHQTDLKRRFAEVFRSKTRAEWEHFGQENDCCLEPVLRPDELLSDPHLLARKLFLERQTGDGVVRSLRTPVTPEDMPVRPPPLPGEHTDAILREAGFADGEIARLRSAAAIR